MTNEIVAASTPNSFRQLKPTRWYAAWFEVNPSRLLLEQQSMNEKFPQFQLFRNGNDLSWVGSLTTNRNNPYLLNVRYPAKFPYEAPQVFPVEPVIQVNDASNPGRYKHQYPDGHLCLYYPGDYTFSPNTTAATVVAVAAAWLFAYESWVESGYRDWPGPEAPEQLR